MQSADALHLVLANVQDSGQASAALTISSSAGITAPAELTDQLLADLRKPEVSIVCLLTDAAQAWPGSLMLSLCCAGALCDTWTGLAVKPASAGRQCCSFRAAERHSALAWQLTAEELCSNTRSLLVSSPENRAQVSAPLRHVLLPISVNAAPQGHVCQEACSCM